jgi:hypothetical protein
MNNDYNRLLEQSIDIFIYDIKNKYETLKLNGISKDNIDYYMNDYQKNKIKDFTNNYSKIKRFYKN